MSSETRSAKDCATSKEGSHGTYRAVFDGYRALLHDMGNLTLPLLLLTDPDFGMCDGASEEVRAFLEQVHPHAMRVSSTLNAASDTISEWMREMKDEPLGDATSERQFRQSTFQVGERVIGALESISDELTRLAGACETFLNGRALAQAQREHIWCIYTEAVSCADLVDSSLSSDEEVREDLHTLIEQNVVILRSLLGSGVTLRLRFTSQVVGVRLTRAVFLRILLNLTVNARRAMGGVGVFTISTSVQGDSAVLAVEDNGCGMTPDLLRRVLEERYSTKPDPEQHGIGVYIIRTSVEEKCGGTLRAESVPGKGTVWYLTFPRELH